MEFVGGKYEIVRISQFEYSIIEDCILNALHKVANLNVGHLQVYSKPQWGRIPFFLKQTSISLNLIHG